MGRVAQLAVFTDLQLSIEAEAIRRGFDADKVRANTRVVLAAWAHLRGFPENEISSAIDTALKGR